MEMVNNDIALQLIQYITDNNLQPGAKLPAIRELATTWNCNPSQVRTGLITLSAIGVIETHPRAGSFVKRLSPENMNALVILFFRLGMLGTRHDIANLYEVKTLLDREVFENAVIYRNERDLYEISLILERQHSFLSDSVSFIAADEEFHVRLAQIIRNSLVVYLIKTIQEIIRPYRLQQFNLQQCEEAYEDHKQIFEAIKNQDKEQAKEMASMHSHQRLQRLATIKDVHS